MTDDDKTVDMAHREEAEGIFKVFGGARGFQLVARYLVVGADLCRICYDIIVRYHDSFLCRIYKSVIICSRAKKGCAPEDLMFHSSSK